MATKKPAAQTAATTTTQKVEAQAAQDQSNQNQSDQGKTSAAAPNQLSLAEPTTQTTNPVETTLNRAELSREAAQEKQSKKKKASKSTTEVVVDERAERIKKNAKQLMDARIAASNARIEGDTEELDDTDSEDDEEDI